MIIITYIASLSAYSITVPDYIYVVKEGIKEPIRKRLKVPPGTGRIFFRFSPENLHL
jgi:hypothetical protein